MGREKNSALRGPRKKIPIFPVLREKQPEAFLLRDAERSTGQTVSQRGGRMARWRKLAAERRWETCRTEHLVPAASEALSSSACSSSAVERVESQIPERRAPRDASRPHQTARVHPGSQNRAARPSETALRSRPDPGGRWTLRPAERRSRWGLCVESAQPGPR